MRLFTSIMLSVCFVSLTNLAKAADSQDDGQSALYDESASDPYLDAVGQDSKKSNHIADDGSDDGVGAPEDDVSDSDSFSFDNDDSLPASPKRVKSATSKKSVKKFRSVELNLSPTNLMKDYPVAGGIGISGEIEVKDQLCVYASGDFNRYSDLGSSPIYNERPYNYTSMSLSYLDHSRLSAGARYYLVNNGNHSTYVGGSLAFAKWQSDYVTDTAQVVTGVLEETVLAAEAGYRWQASGLPLVLRAGAGLGWAIPLTHEVSGGPDAYEQELAGEVQNLELYRIRPSLQLGVGYSY